MVRISAASCIFRWCGVAMMWQQLALCVVGLFSGHLELVQAVPATSVSSGTPSGTTSAGTLQPRPSFATLMAAEEKRLLEEDIKITEERIKMLEEMKAQLPPDSPLLAPLENFDVDALLDPDVSFLPTDIPEDWLFERLRIEDPTKSLLANVVPSASANSIHSGGTRLSHLLLEVDEINVVGSTSSSTHQDQDRTSGGSGRSSASSATVFSARTIENDLLEQKVHTAIRNATVVSPAEPTAVAESARVLLNYELVSARRVGTSAATSRSEDSSINAGSRTSSSSSISSAVAGGEIPLLFHNATNFEFRLLRVYPKRGAIARTGVRNKGNAPAPADRGSKSAEKSSASRASSSENNGNKTDGAKTTNETGSSAPAVPDVVPESMFFDMSSRFALVSLDGAPVDRARGPSADVEQAKTENSRQDSAASITIHQFPTNLTGPIEHAVWRGEKLYLAQQHGGFAVLHVNGTVLFQKNQTCADGGPLRLSTSAVQKGRALVTCPRESKIFVFTDALGSLRDITPGLVTQKLVDTAAILDSIPGRPLRVLAAYTDSLVSYTLTSGGSGVQWVLPQPGLHSLHLIKRLLFAQKRNPRRDHDRSDEKLELFNITEDELPPTVVWTKRGISSYSLGKTVRDDVTLLSITEKKEDGRGGSGTSSSLKKEGTMNEGRWGKQDTTQRIAKIYEVVDPGYLRAEAEEEAAAWNAGGFFGNIRLPTMLFVVLGVLLYQSRYGSLSSLLSSSAGASSSPGGTSATANSSPYNFGGRIRPPAGGAAPGASTSSRLPPGNFDGYNQGAAMSTQAIEQMRDELAGLRNRVKNIATDVHEGGGVLD
ncbi:unnamed protein product [Amoebophrya sp. A120]|nr:unnamed protein product [Amoebophrya sp. A120]|eukprot:GSA120T00011286001.1